MLKSKLYTIISSLTGLALCSLALTAWTQDNSAQGLSVESLQEQIARLQIQRPLCFGLRSIEDPAALEVCDALALGENVRARELSENWIRSEPNSPAAQYALAEVLLDIEGNMPRALFHLNAAEELSNYNSFEEAFGSGNFQWHYLTISQLSRVHQLMGDQLKALEYLDKITTIYDQDMESFRGWPLIKLKDYDAARASANAVLQSSDDERERARAWNTLCAADLASLTPLGSVNSCDETINDEKINDGENDYDTVYLTNASEVALSLLQIDKAEDYLNRATRFLNPNSPADPWIYMLYLTMNQSRFPEAKAALDNMLSWRESQSPLVAAMNLAEHHMVSASFLLLAGYPQDTVKLTQASLNQPDRNGSYSADDFQKDAMASLINMMGHRALYEVEKENLATEDFLDSFPARFRLAKHRVNAWRAEKRAASLFAESDILQNRLRPYAPLDIHIPEWIEPEMVRIMGAGVIASLLEQARANGAFMLNEGYYLAYKTEIAAISSNSSDALRYGKLALAQLPSQESLLIARVNLRLAQASWQLKSHDEALQLYQVAMLLDPSIVRRTSSSIPVSLRHDDSPLSNAVASYLKRSPRFHVDNSGFTLEISNSTSATLCLKDKTDKPISCYVAEAIAEAITEAITDSVPLTVNDQAKYLVQQFHRNTFSLDLEISQAKRSMLLGSSVILSAQLDQRQQQRQSTLSAKP